MEQTMRPQRPALPAVADPPRAAGCPQDADAARRRTVFGLLAGAAAAAAGTARAQAFPSRPIRILIGFAPGGTQDVLARGVGEIAGKALGQPILVEHRAGAAGRIAVEAVRNAPPDGHTLLLATGAMMSLYPHVYAGLKYDPVKDFAPIVNGASFELAMNLQPGIPVTNVREFVAWARTQGEAGSRLNFASYGAGTPSHFAGEMLNQAAGLKMVHVPYKGSAPARQDFLGGQVPVFFDVVGGSLPFAQSGRAKIIATTGARRSPFMPDVPTFVEQGYKDIVAGAWFAFVAPAGTPRAVVERLNAEFNLAIASRELRQRLLVTGMYPIGGTSAELAQTIRADLDRWGRAVRASGFKAME
jgi:tripartite-type tricarboxylate transporter receptor subunit TctC